MRRIPLILLGLSLACLPSLSQEAGDDIPYKVKFDPANDVEPYMERDGTKFIKVKFQIEGESPDYRQYAIKIFEDDKEVKEIKMPPPRPTGGLSVVLVVDTGEKIKNDDGQKLVHKAVDVFFEDLARKEAAVRKEDPKAKSAECGLILFNDRIRETLPLSRDRRAVLSAIQAVEPSGGDACLDATAKAIQMLQMPSDKARAVVLISNGLDRFSTRATKQSVIQEARKHNVTIHTIGIGEKSVQRQLSTVLVLDHSGSMKAPANDTDKAAKIEGLHKAAAAFLRGLPTDDPETRKPRARTALIPFSSKVEVIPSQLQDGDDSLKETSFTSDTAGLQRQVERLKAEGETALFDALYAALSTLDADDPTGRDKRVIVAMTDGIDNISRHGPDEVIEQARQAKIPLYLLGFGRDHELDADTMKKMGELTGGQYFHARDQESLLKFFKDLATKISEDGIDEEMLKAIAFGSPKGTYSHAKHIKGLSLALAEVNKALGSRDEVVTFKSLRQVADGTVRPISLKLVRYVPGGGQGGKDKEEILNTQTGTVQEHGVVIAQADHLVYLTLLGVIGSLIVLPSVFKK